MNKVIIPNPKTYKLLDCLHESQNSQVFKVLCEDSESKMSQTQIMKIINSKNSFQDCIKELKSLEQVKSPFCVSFYTWENINKKPALILEYIEGINLKKLIQHSTLSKEEVSYLADKIFQGLKDLNSYSLYHGDLSLNNVMVDMDGNIKLIDYGLSNTQGRYTPNFVAPEVFAERAYSFQADLYSLGRIIKFLDGFSDQYEGLLLENPEQRFFKRKNYRSSAKKSLARKVKEALLSGKRTTRGMVVSKNAKKYNLKVLFLIVFLFLSSSALKSEGFDSKPSYLTIKSKSWNEVKINNNLVGYSPFFAREVKSGELFIKWSGPEGEGETALTLLPGEHKVLNIQK